MELNEVYRAYVRREASVVDISDYYFDKFRHFLRVYNSNEEGLLDPERRKRVRIKSGRAFIQACDVLYSQLKSRNH